MKLEQIQMLEGIRENVHEYLYQAMKNTALQMFATNDSIVETLEDRCAIALKFIASAADEVDCAIREIELMDEDNDDDNGTDADLLENADTIPE